MDREALGKVIFFLVSRCSHIGIIRTVLIAVDFLSGMTLKFANSSRYKRATYLIAEYHLRRLQSTPLGKLSTDSSA
jgi:hypothetical protein